jgi:hypothetical protein
LDQQRKIQVAKVEVLTLIHGGQEWDDEL